MPRQFDHVLGEIQGVSKSTDVDQIANDGVPDRADLAGGADHGDRLRAEQGRQIALGGRGANLQLFFNDGTGAFQTPVRVPTGSPPRPGNRSTNTKLFSVPMWMIPATVSCA